MAIKNALASVAVKDLKISAEWYKKLFNREPDSIPMAEVMEWKFAGGGWLQVYQSKERAGFTSVTLSVSDIDDQVNLLKNLDIDHGEPIITEKVKIIMIKDPDKNSIAFAEALDSYIAQ